MREQESGGELELGKRSNYCQSRVFFDEIIMNRNSFQCEAMTCHSKTLKKGKKGHTSLEPFTCILVSALTFLFQVFFV